MVGNIFLQKLQVICSLLIQFSKLVLLSRFSLQLSHLYVLVPFFIWNFLLWFKRFDSVWILCHTVYSLVPFSCKWFQILILVPKYCFVSHHSQFVHLTHCLHEDFFFLGVGDAEGDICQSLSILWLLRSFSFLAEYPHSSQSCLVMYWVSSCSFFVQVFLCVSSIWMVLYFWLPVNIWSHNSHLICCKVFCTNECTGSLCFTRILGTKVLLAFYFFVCQAMWIPNPCFVITRPGDLVMPDPFGWLFSQHSDYFRTYKNQVEPGYKGHPIELM